MSETPDQITDKVHPKLPLIKKGRKGGPHSKKGCTTCRQRHIKCDESRPACFRCTSTGRQCDYGFLDRSSRSRTGSPDAVNLIGRSTSTPPVPSIIGLLPQGNRDDFRYIQFFHLRSAPALLGYYEGDQPFWSKLLLQASFTDAAVRHAVVAVSFTFELFEKAQSEGFSSTQQGSGWNRMEGEGFKAYLESKPVERDFILRQYNHAIRSLTQREPGCCPSKEVILITCVLFICLEFLRENVEGALMHLSSGLQVLRMKQGTGLATPEPESSPSPPPIASANPYPSDSGVPPDQTESNTMLRPPATNKSRSVSQAANGSRSVSPAAKKAGSNSPALQDSHEIGTMMLPLFFRLSCLASFFGKPMFDKISSDVDLQDLSIPPSFPSLTEAHNAMTIILTRTFAFYRQCTPSRYARAVSDTSAFFPTSRLSKGRHRTAEHTKSILTARLTAWSSSFTSFLASNIADLSSPSLRTVSYLKSLKHILNIFLGTCFSPYEIAYDAHLADFKAIVSYATSLADVHPGDDSSSSSSSAAEVGGGTVSGSSTSFTFEMGIVPNLYWAAIKCRHHAVRWRAIRLLRRCRRREGLWDSALDARVATKVVELEEEGTVFNDTDGDEHYDRTMAVTVPDAKRVYDAAIQNQPRGRLGGHPVHISTRLAGPGKDFVTKSYFV
ncbi:MAG: hypothetical protein Q9160_005806 [Pyrenula sp. 1 TL-2023]